MSDQLVRYVTRNGHFRVIVAETIGICETARKKHGTDPTATVALSRLTTGTALLGGLLKDRQRLAVAIEANGPLQKLHAETDAFGQVRCTVKNPLAELPPRNDRFDVANAVGLAGFLHVIKDLGLKEPYRGMVQLQTSEIGDDIAYYLTTSEQVPSSVALGVKLDADAAVAAAGGFLIQALPGCDDAEIERIEARIKELPPLSSILENKSLPQQVQQHLFAGFDCSPAETISLQFRCTCNRQQVASMLHSLGKQELDELVTKNEIVDVTCEYCREVYSFSPAELTRLS